MAPVVGFHAEILFLELLLALYNNIQYSSAIIQFHHVMDEFTHFSIIIDIFKDRTRRNQSCFLIDNSLASLMEMILYGDILDKTKF